MPRISEQSSMSESIAVIGLGYVGLPLAVALARAYPGTIGFDASHEKVRSLKRGMDETGSVSSDELLGSGLQVLTDPSALADRTFYIIAVPTPVDRNNQPDLSYLTRASEVLGGFLSPGAVVVYESTVYPGVTEEICGPVLEKASGLRQGVDFKLGYSPERINPGDREHTLDRVIKVVSAQDPATLERVAAVYSGIVPAGVYRAPSIKVAEAAKVIENTQRDLNIALMNELALIFDRIGIRTRDVLATARTKWNFLPFSPGLVGGHCIGVDPYYLTTKAQQMGYLPQVILAGRRINNDMPRYLAQRLVKLMIHSDILAKGAKVSILGLSFKENVPDIRNSRVPEIVKELREFGIQPLVHDPLADPEDTLREYGIELSPWEDLADSDALVLAVAHDVFIKRPLADLVGRLRPNGVIVDVKSALDPEAIPEGLAYWCL